MELKITELEGKTHLNQTFNFFWWGFMLVFWGVC